MTTLFNAVRKFNQFGDGTAGKLVSWLECYINILFQGNGIEYWHCPDRTYGEPHRLKSNDRVPTGEGGEEGIHHIGCYVHKGSCEGWMIEVCLILRNGNRKVLTAAKSFGKEGENWAIAQAVYQALDSILLYGEVPQIVELAMTLPGIDKWFRETTLRETVTISATESTLEVITPSGEILQSLNFKSMGPNAKFTVKAYVKDWQTVLSNMKVNYELKNQRRVFVKDLPCYVISDRGVEGITGVYVLPPGGNPLDDRDYLGYFKTDEEGIAAARKHRDGVLAASSSNVPA